MIPAKDFVQLLVSTFEEENIISGKRSRNIFNDLLLLVTQIVILVVKTHCRADTHHITLRSLMKLINPFACFMR